MSSTTVYTVSVTRTESSDGGTTMSLQGSSRDPEAGTFYHLKHAINPVIPEKAGQHSGSDNLSTCQRGMRQQPSSHRSTETFKSQYHNAVKHKTASEILRNRFEHLQREANQKSCATYASIPSGSHYVASENDGASLLPKIKEVFYTVSRDVKRSGAGESEGGSTSLESSSPYVLVSPLISPSLAADMLHKPDLRTDSASLEGTCSQPRQDNELYSLNSQTLKHSGKISSLQKRPQRKLEYSYKMPQMSHPTLDKNTGTQIGFSCEDATQPAIGMVPMPESPSDDCSTDPPSDMASGAHFSQITLSGPQQVIKSPLSCHKHTEKKITDVVFTSAGVTGVQVAVISEERVALEAASSIAGTCDSVDQHKLSAVTANYSDSSLKSADHTPSKEQDGKSAIDDGCKMGRESSVVKATRSLLHQALELAAVGIAEQGSSISSNEIPVDRSAYNTRWSKKKASSRSTLSRKIGPTRYVKIKPKLQDSAKKNVMAIDPNVAAAVSSLLFKRKNVHHQSVAPDDKVSDQLSLHCQQPLINTYDVSSSMAPPEGVMQTGVSSLASQRSCMEGKEGYTYTSASAKVAPQLSVTQENSQTKSVLIMTGQGPMLFWGRDPKFMYAAKINLSTLPGSTAMELQDESQLSACKDKVPSKSQNETNSEAISNLKFSIKQEPEEVADYEMQRNSPSVSPSRQVSEVKQEAGLMDLSNHSEDSALIHPQEKVPAVTYAVPNVSLIADASFDVKVDDKERLEKENIEVKSRRWLVLQTESSKCEVFRCGENEQHNSDMAGQAIHQGLTCYCKTSMRAGEVYNAMKAHVKMVKIQSLQEHHQQNQQGDSKEKTKLSSSGEREAVCNKTIPVLGKRFKSSIVKKKKGHNCGKAAKQVECVNAKVTAENSMPASASAIHAKDLSFHIKPVQARCAHKRRCENGKEVSLKKRCRKKSIDQTVGESSGLTSPSREEFDIYVEVDESILANDSFSLDGVSTGSRGSLTELCVPDPDRLEKGAEGETQTEVEDLFNDQQEIDDAIGGGGQTVIRGSVRHKGGLSRISAKSKSTCGLCKTLSCQTGGKSSTKQLQKHERHNKHERYQKCKRQEKQERHGFGCQRCRFVGNSKEELKEHIALEHTGRPLYTCSECLLQFFNLDIFQKHQQRHESGFQCSVCKMKFETDAIMQEHKYLQHVRPYYCPLCLHKVVGLDDLKEHLNSCLGDYKCCVCLRNCKTVMEVKDHGRLFHSVELTVCCACGLSFESNTDHMAHNHIKEACSYPDIMDRDKLAAYMKRGIKQFCVNLHQQPVHSLPCHTANL